MSFDLAVNSIVEVRAYCYAVDAKQLGVNAFKLKVTALAGGAVVDAAAWVAALSADIAPEYKPLLDSGAKYLGMSMQDFPARAFAPVWTKNGAGDGTTVGADTPTQISGLITWYTNSAGRRGRGRTYIPFPSVTDNTAQGLPSVGYVANLTSLIGAIMAPQTTVVGAVTVTFVLGIMDGAGAGAFKPVTNAIGRSKWATQRRRGSFGRLNDIPTFLQ